MSRSALYGRLLPAKVAATTCAKMDASLILAHSNPVLDSQLPSTALSSGTGEFTQVNGQVL